MYPGLQIESLYLALLLEGKKEKTSKFHKRGFKKRPQYLFLLFHTPLINFTKELGISRL
jgi:hypothetical protein